jgi:hypothetical protein
MNNVQLQDLARVGAQSRLAALDTEREALLKLFPDLRASQRPAAGKNGSAPPAARKRKGMSPAARKAHGERMRAYWADRRAESGDSVASQRETAADASPAAANQARGRKGMSPAARKAQGERMRAYWAAKRAGKAGAASADAPSRGASPTPTNQRTVRKK